MEWCDNSRIGSNIREFNITLLEKEGFEECGLFSRSGELYLEPRNYGAVIVFGIAANVGGKKWNKYFSLCKRFKSEKEGKKYFKNLIKRLKKA